MPAPRRRHAAVERSRLAKRLAECGFEHEGLEREIGVRHWWRLGSPRLVFAIAYAATRKWQTGPSINLAHACATPFLLRLPIFGRALLVLPLLPDDSIDRRGM